MRMEGWEELELKRERFMRCLTKGKNGSKKVEIMRKTSEI